MTDPAIPALAPETLLALAAFAFPATWTPGPNNMMLAASGASFGWRASLPHAMGVALGFPVMFFLVALGLGQAFEALPAFRAGLGWLGCGVMLWLAWRIATAAPAPVSAEGGGDGGAGEGARRRRPLGFIGAAAFQWVNPKAWVLCLSVSAAFATGRDPVLEALAGMLVFTASGLSSSQAWVLFGAGTGRLIGRGRGLRLFNGAMGAMLAASALWLVLDPVA